MEHNFGGGTYAKEMRIPAGIYIVQHSHSYAHLGILAQGIAEVTLEGEVKTFSAPCCILLPANYNHKITAVTEAVWYCVHATDVTDPELIDASIMEGNDHASH